MDLFFKKSVKKLLILCVSWCCGCQLPQEYTVHEEYVEKNRWDQEKGWVRDPKASVTVEWKN